MRTWLSVTLACLWQFSVCQVAGTAFFLRASAEPFLAGDRCGLSVRGAADHRRKTGVSASESHRALGCDRTLRDHGFCRQQHPERCPERSFGDSGNGADPADLCQRRHSGEILWAVSAEADEPPRCLPAVHESGKCRMDAAPSDRGLGNHKNTGTGAVNAPVPVFCYGSIV